MGRTKRRGVLRSFELLFEIIMIAYWYPLVKDQFATGVVRS
jgi:hypothetical protein